ncbi:alcohol dehydrogenase-like regulatory protein ErcA [uncultured Methanoregula sp.]|uniref:alcohol dehydrogenase-like regulatory protein ErcA n=1 Tax=uncultured Methanoregula sp. TaxID=1005933 RepID=UPI002AABC012|nr:alcohol dehydrogenase-like regulatory protein ErcA [uncultured Methanoregula sp.]
MVLATLEMRKFVAPEFVIGSDARRLAGRYAKNFGATNVFVVTGPNIIKAGWVKDVTDSLDAEGIRYTIFSDVTPNPRDFEVMNGAELYEQKGCNAIIAVGGGSPIDCAKGIGIVASNKKHILTFEGVDTVALPPPPLICIPTTAGTGADVSQFAIINDTKRRVKIAIISKKIVPDIALVDPVPLTSLSPDLTANTGMDAITHSVEAYVSNASSPVTDTLALESIAQMSDYLLLAQRNPGNIEYRNQTLLGSLLGGLAFSNASLGIVHAMAHSLGGFSDLPHGACNAILLGPVIEFNFEACPDRYEAIGNKLNAGSAGRSPEEIKNNVLSAIRSLRESLGDTHTLSGLGVSYADIPELAKKAKRDPCLATNPRIPTIADIERIYERAF